MRMPRGVFSIACLGVLLIGAAALGASPPAAHTSNPKIFSSPAPAPGGPPLLLITGFNSCECTGPDKGALQDSECGCAEKGITVFFVYSNLPTGSVGHALVIVNGVVYMDAVSDPLLAGDNSGSGSITLQFENQGGTATGTWPLPPGQPVEIRFTDELPLGTIVTGWRSVLADCGSSCAFYESAFFNGRSIPAATTLGLAALAALLLIAGVIVLLRVRTS